MVICLGKQHESKKISLNIFVKRLSSITKKGEIESPSLVLIIDETYVLTFVMRCDMRYVGTSKCGAWWQSSDGDDHMK